MNGNTLKSGTCVRREILESFLGRHRATYKWWQNWMLPREGEGGERVWDQRTMTLSSSFTTLGEEGSAEAGRREKRREESDGMGWEVSAQMAAKSTKISNGWREAAAACAACAALKVPWEIQFCLPPPPTCPPGIHLVRLPNPSSSDLKASILQIGGRPRIWQ